MVDPAIQYSRRAAEIDRLGSTAMVCNAWLCGGGKPSLSLAKLTSFCGFGPR
jgi:hypothetical protein